MIGGEFLMIALLTLIPSIYLAIEILRNSFLRGGKVHVVFGGFVVFLISTIFTYVYYLYRIYTHTFCESWGCFGAMPYVLFVWAVLAVISIIFVPIFFFYNKDRLFIDATRHLNHAAKFIVVMLLVVSSTTTFIKYIDATKSQRAFDSIAVTKNNTNIKLHELLPKGTMSQAGMSSSYTNYFTGDVTGDGNVEFVFSEINTRKVSEQKVSVINHMGEPLSKCLTTAARSGITKVKFNNKDAVAMFSTIRDTSNEWHRNTGYKTIIAFRIIDPMTCGVLYEYKMINKKIGVRLDPKLSISDNGKIVRFNIYDLSSNNMRRRYIIDIGNNIGKIESDLDAMEYKYYNTSKSLENARLKSFPNLNIRGVWTCDINGDGNFENVVSFSVTKDERPVGNKIIIIDSNNSIIYTSKQLGVVDIVDIDSDGKDEIVFTQRDGGVSVIEEVD